MSFLYVKIKDLYLCHHAHKCPQSEHPEWNTDQVLQTEIYTHIKHLSDGQVRVSKRIQFLVLCIFNFLTFLHFKPVV